MAKKEKTIVETKKQTKKVKESEVKKEPKVKLKKESSVKYVRVGDIEPTEGILTTNNDDTNLMWVTGTTNTFYPDFSDPIASPGYSLSDWQNNLGEPKSEPDDKIEKVVNGLIIGKSPFSESDYNKNISTTYIEKIDEVIYLLKPKQSPANLEELTLEQLSIIKNRLIEISSMYRGDVGQFKMLNDTNYKINRINEEISNRINIINW